MSDLRGRLVYAAYSAGWGLTKRVPERLALGTFVRIADIAWRRRVKGVRRLEQNLRRVRPGATDAELDVLTRATMRSYFRYWCEMFRLRPLSEAEAREQVIIHDEQLFRDALARGRGVVVALPHMANFELAGVWACATGTPVTSVAERVRPERLFDRFIEARRRIGFEVLPLTGGEDRFGVLADRLRAGGLVCLVSDRDLTDRGLEVSFFGEKARMPPGPAALAVRTGAALLPATLWYDGPRTHVRFHPEVPRPEKGQAGARNAVGSMTQQVADAFAEGIAEHPTDWHMLQRVWVADLDPDRRPAGSAASAASAEGRG